jgi:septum formation inhibitor MinC
MDNNDQESLVGEREGMVTARGTGDGLVIRLDGSVDPSDLREALAEFLASRRSFLGGNEVALEWVGTAPEQAMVDALSNFVQKDFQITVKESRFRDLRRAGESSLSDKTRSDTTELSSQASKKVGSSPIVSVRSLKSSFEKGQISSAESASTSSTLAKRSIQGKQATILSDTSDYKAGYRAPISTDLDGYDDSRGDRSKKVSLFDGIDVMNIPDEEADVPSRTYSGNYGGDASSPQRSKAFNPLIWDDPDARIVNMTLRSGQKVESDHSVIIRGDVNSGAEVIAGGDIIVLGTLRGIAHAGAFDDTGGGRTITALSLQPTQLRIGSLISRGKSEAGGNEGGQGIEIARIEGNIIAVEPYQVRGTSRRG